MIKLAHYDDGKEKRQSNSICFYSDSTTRQNLIKRDIYSMDLTELTGYGKTKEDAIRDFKEKFSYLMAEWKAVENMLFDTDILENDIVEVDCLGVVINNLR